MSAHDVQCPLVSVPDLAHVDACDSCDLIAAVRDAILAAAIAGLWRLAEDSPFIRLDDALDAINSLRDEP